MKVRVVMEVTPRAKKVRRLKRLMEDANRGVRILFVLGLLFGAPALWLLTLNDIGQTGPWIGLVAFFPGTCWTIAGIIWGVGVRESRLRILHREL